LLSKSIRRGEEKKTTFTNKNITHPTHCREEEKQENCYCYDYRAKETTNVMSGKGNNQCHVLGGRYNKSLSHR
jgi:hypothetical protein